MSDRAWGRVGAAAGIVYVALIFVRFAFFTTPELGADADEITRFFAMTDSSRVQAGAYVDVIGHLFLVVFAARLWAALRAAEGEGGWMSTAAFGAALVSAALGLAGIAALGPPFLHPASASATVSLMDVSLLLIWLSQAVIALFLGAASVVIVRTGVLPSWAGWTGGAIAVALLGTIPLAATSGIPHIPATLGGAWIVAVAIVLLVRPERAAAARG